MARAQCKSCVELKMSEVTRSLAAGPAVAVFSQQGREKVPSMTALAGHRLDCAVPKKQLGGRCPSADRNCIDAFGLV